MTTALVPVKRLEQSKSRLLSHLSDDMRQSLTLAMLDDLLEALTTTAAITRIAVTTPDPLVAEHARAAGAVVLMRKEPGLNAALEDGIARLAADPVPQDADDSILLVLGDVAGALPDDLERLLRASRKTRGPGVWLAASADGGTSALLQRPPGVLPCCFGPDSAERHRQKAHELGIAYHALSLPSLAIDLDEPEDLDRFLATETGGRRTRALLEAIGYAPSQPRRSDGIAP